MARPKPPPTPRLPVRWTPIPPAAPMTREQWDEYWQTLINENECPACGRQKTLLDRYPLERKGYTVTMSTWAPCKCATK
jgi:hypothetical protein